MLFPGEEEAVKYVIKAGKKYGYGNMIAHLKREWAEKLMAQGVPKEGALLAANTSAYPVRTVVAIDIPEYMNRIRDMENE